jgi:hypothetical protein
MDYKERIKNDIKDKKIKEMWEEISDAFKEDGSNGVKILLDNCADEFFDNYISALKQLEKLL